MGENIMEGFQNKCHAYGIWIHRAQICYHNNMPTALGFTRAQICYQNVMPSALGFAFCNY
jgi:hypothetical protein